MTWLISKALYESWPCSQEQEEESLEVTCSDGKPSAQLSGSHTQLAYLQPDKMTGFSRLSRYGMTFRPLTERNGEDLLMWYREDFLAKTLAKSLPATAISDQKESKENGLKCGGTWLASLAKYDPNSHTLKTVQPSLFEDLMPSSVTLPRWGTMQNGAVYLQTPAEPTMSDTESGSLLPTPTKHNSKEGGYPAEGARHSPGVGWVVGGKIHPMFTEWMMGWPLGWTDLRPLETAKFQSWQQQHSAFSQETKK